MDASASKSSHLSDASSAPPAQKEPVRQEDQHNDKTAKEKQLAAAKLRLDQLPMLKILSIMRKVLPEDANLDADVDLVMRTCVAKFTGYLISESKEQKTLARHRILRSEDIISALEVLGFKDASTALSLYYSRLTGMTNYSQPREVHPVHTSEPISTEIQQKDRANDSTEDPIIGSTNVQSPVHNSEQHRSPVHNYESRQSPVHNSEPHQSPVHNSELHQSPVHSEPNQSPVHNSELNTLPVHNYEPNQSPVHNSEPHQSPVHSSEPHQSPVHSSEPHQSPVRSEPKQSPVHNSEPNQSPVHNYEPNQSPVRNSEPHKSPVCNSEPHKSPVHDGEPLLTEMLQLKGGLDVPTENTLGPNEGNARVGLPVHTIEPLSTELQQQGTNVQLPVHSVDPFLAEMQWEGSVNVSSGDDYEHFEGNTTMLPPPSPFESLPSSIVQPLLVQQNEQERTMLDRVVPLVVQNPDTTPYLVNMQPPSAPVQQNGSVQGDPFDANPHLGNAYSSQMMAHSDAQQVPKQAESFKASPFTQPMNQPAFPGSTQLASQQQNEERDGTTMAIDGILGTETGSTSGADFDEVMSDADLADAIKLLKEYGVYSDVP